MAKDANDAIELPKGNRVRTSEAGDEEVDDNRTPSESTPTTIPNFTADSPTRAAAGVVSAKTASKAYTERFLKLSGYKASDVIGSNEDRRTFVTSNGGKYELNAKGTKLRVLAGPNPPATEEGDDE